MLKKLILTLAAASFGAAAAPAADEIINPVMRLNDKAQIRRLQPRDRNRRTVRLPPVGRNRRLGKNRFFGRFRPRRQCHRPRRAPAPLLRAGRFREPKTGVFCNYTFAVKPAGENAAKLHITVTPESPEKLRELF
ncbi:MAG: hypothetical protein V8T86_03130 [Victivallis sp.]